MIYMCVEGKASFKYNGEEEELIKGETILVPACLKEFEIKVDQKAVLLEVFIQ